MATARRCNAARSAAVSPLAWSCCAWRASSTMSSERRLPAWAVRSLSGKLSRRASAARSRAVRVPMVAATSTTVAGIVCSDRSWSARRAGSGRLAQISARTRFASGQYPASPPTRPRVASGTLSESALAPGEQEALAAGLNLTVTASSTGHAPVPAGPPWQSPERPEVRGARCSGPISAAALPRNCPEARDARFPCGLITPRPRSARVSRCRKSRGRAKNGSHRDYSFAP